MMKVKVIALLFAFVFMLSISYSQTTSIPLNSSMKSFLYQYMPNSTIQNSSFYSIAYNSTNYIIMHNQNGYLLISIPYSLVTNTTAAAQVFKEFIIEEHPLNATLLHTLNKNIAVSVNQTQGGFAKCLFYTGLNKYSCTTANNCAACLSVASCANLFSNGSYTPILENAIINFSTQYNLYNNSFRNFAFIVSVINSSNYYQYSQRLIEDAKNITDIPVLLQHNALFPVPSNFSASLFKNCPYFPSLTSQWYCQSLSYCNRINLNYTLINQTKATISRFQIINITNASIGSMSKNATTLAAAYINALFVRDNAASFSNKIINETKPKYNAALANATSVESKVSNSMFSSLVFNMQNTYNSIISKGIYQNITLANATIANLISKVDSQSANMSSAYYSLYNKSLNNTALILRTELEYPNNVTTANMAIKQEKINALFNEPVNYSSFDSINASMSSLRSEALAFPPQQPTIPQFVKSVDSGFINMLAYAIPGSAESKISSSPLYATLLSFIIGMVLISVIFGFAYSRSRKKQKASSKKTSLYPLIMAFLIMFIAVLIYSYITYAYASMANSSLPASSFLNSVNSSSNIAIALNSTVVANASVIQCANATESNLKDIGKTVTIIPVKGYSCTVVSNTSFANPGCIEQLMNNDTPIIMLNQNGSYIKYKGLYGNILYASGVPTEGSSCFLSVLFKK